MLTKPQQYQNKLKLDISYELPFQRRPGFLKSQRLERTRNQYLDNPQNKQIKQQILNQTLSRKKQRLKHIRSLRKKQLHTQKKLEEKKKQQIWTCQVCYISLQEKSRRQFGKCKHIFCQQCVKNQIENALKNFKPVKCLQDQCPQTLEYQSILIQTLPLPKLQRYYKILVFMNLSKMPNIKLCPSDSCEGFLDIQQKPLQCPICQIQFCLKCLNRSHGGDCDANGVNFMETNYNFRRCSQCKMVLQKNQGCNHMTCKCGYQFCYLCGAKWSQSHKCSQSSETNNIIPARRNASLTQDELHLPEFLPGQIINRRPPRPAVVSPINNRIVQQCSFKRVCLYGLIGVILFFCHIITFEVVWLILLGLGSCIFLFIVAIGLSFIHAACGLQGIRSYSWGKIILGNIFLLLFCFVKLFISKGFPDMRRQLNFWNLNRLFPLTSKLGSSLKHIFSLN